MATHPFLSPEWIEEAKRIREEYRDQTAPLPATVRMNQVITEVPFGDGRIDAYVDTTSGELDMELGALDKPDVTIAVDYATAKALFVEGNAQAAMQAFMAGKIKVTGDMTKLMALQAITPGAQAGEVAQRIQAITE